MFIAAPSGSRETARARTNFLTLHILASSNPLRSGFGAASRRGPLQRATPFNSIEVDCWSIQREIPMPLRFVFLLAVIACTASTYAQAPAAAPAQLPTSDSVAATLN